TRVALGSSAFGRMDDDVFDRRRGSRSGVVYGAPHLRRDRPEGLDLDLALLLGRLLEQADAGRVEEWLSGMRDARLRRDERGSQGLEGRLADPAGRPDPHLPLEAPDSRAVEPGAFAVREQVVVRVVPVPRRPREEPLGARDGAFDGEDVGSRIR